MLTASMDGRSILVYAGEGASHSWTWLADLFETAGVYCAHFVDRDGLIEQSSDGTCSIVISGGDGFQISRALGPSGFAHLKGYIHRGGRFIGVCAGAYLPLPSSIDPFDKFNISTTRIRNISSTRVKAATSPRIAVDYGSCSIVHPVRGDVRVSSSEQVLAAPVYGGPVFEEPDRDEVLLRYSGFTDKTEFQVDASIADAMMLGRPAAIRCRHGRGELVLLGPHLEHPQYPVANSLFLSLLGAAAPREPAKEVVRRSHPDDPTSSALADLKVAVLGLENRSFAVGNKLWDGTRFLELIRAIERRSTSLDSGTASRVAALLSKMRDELLSAEDGSFGDSDEGPRLLIEAARLTVDRHFQALREKG